MAEFTAESALAELDRIVQKESKGSGFDHNQTLEEIFQGCHAALATAMVILGTRLGNVCDVKFDNPDITKIPYGTLRDQVLRKTSKCQIADSPLIAA